MKTMLLMLLLTGMLGACTPGTDEPFTRPPTEHPDENPGGGDDNPVDPPQTALSMKITIGTALFTATLTESATAAAFAGMLPMAVTMNELNGNEKYYNLPESLPTAAFAPGTIRNGDLMLYGAGTLVLFYKTFQSPYNYTPIGRVDDPSGLETALGRGRITVKFEQTNE